MDATWTSEAWAVLALADSSAGTRRFDAHGGRKRVRRIQRELPFYRHQVRGLELQLKRIKLQNATGSTASSSVHCKVECPHHVQVKRPRRDDKSVWNDVAERQLKERLRAEAQQQQLKEMHAELSTWSVELRN